MHLNSSKKPTGVGGLDSITRGGLPTGRTTLLIGGPGSGKTVLALQTLVHGASALREPGIFVAFEESSTRIVSNAATFGWDLPQLQRKNLFFLDAQPLPDLVRSGSFDLLGLLSALEGKVRAMKARRIVFDSIDVLLSLLKDPDLERQEIFRVHEWLLRNELTAVITAKWSDAAPEYSRHALFLQFMVDCAISLRHDEVLGVSQRTLRVVKYRGSGFAENAAPFLIGPHGLEVASSGSVRSAGVTRQKVSTGVPRLDTMMTGGYYRNSSVLVTGSPGTAKSTLAGAFAEAACARGERTLMVSFDSDGAELIRNLASVGIRLAPAVKKGALRIERAQSGEGSAELQYLRIRSAAEEHRARCLVIDPLSSLSKQGNELTVSNVVERLTRWSKSADITLLCTSLLDHSQPELEGTALQISTIADTWIHLSYRIQAGERNRGLSIIKSRGMAHSNQVRELILSSNGITLADVFTAGGEVLMGTLRWEREEAARDDAQARAEDSRRRLATLDAEEQELRIRMKLLEAEISEKRLQRLTLTGTEQERLNQVAERQRGLSSLRQGDPAKNKARKIS